MVGAAVVGAGAALAVRAWRRWRSHDGLDDLRTVARCAVIAAAHRRDAGWEGLAGRALFKQLCARLALEGYPPSDHGDIAALHECVLHAEGVPIYLVMRPVDRDWEVVVSRTPSVDGRPGLPPRRDATTRRFLGALDRALHALEETEEIRWLRREDAR